MNILRLSTLSLTLAIAVFSLGYVNSSSAAPKNCVENDHRPSCNGDDDQNLQARFDLTIDMTGTQYILSDDGNYPDSSKDHVGVFTGSGPGFRFDTNLQNTNKLSRWLKARHVYMTVTGSPTPPDLAYEIDFRFNQTNGLDLGSLEVSKSGTVAASLQYFGGNLVAGFNSLNYGILGFGALNAPNPTHEVDEACLDAGGMIKVTRISDTQWTLESQKGRACRFALDANGDSCTNTNSCGVSNQVPAVIAFDFKFTITQQD